MIIKGKTSTGFAYAFDERLRNDWRILAAIADSESDDATLKIKGTTNLVRLFLGVEGEAKLMAHIAELNEGFVPATAVTAELVDILKGDAKTLNPRRNA